jgi:hypothetical protein
MGARPIAIIIHQDMVTRNLMIVKASTSDQVGKVMWFFSAFGICGTNNRHLQDTHRPLRALTSNANGPATTTQSALGHFARQLSHEDCLDKKTCSDRQGTRGNMAKSNTQNDPRDDQLQPVHGCNA